MVRLQNITKTFGPVRVLQGLSLEFEAGERFVLLGPSGCGKTTLLRLIAGFESPDAGSIHIEGENVGSLPVERRPVGFIFQRHALFPHMTVYDNIAVGPRIRRMEEREIARRVGELLEITRMGHRRDARPLQLSGGESQRVALARALINRPKLLLLDEPLSALDETLRQSLREELADMQQALGTTFLFVTHDREEAMSLAHRMGVLHEGRTLQTGTPEDLYDRPDHPFVARFLGEVNRLPGVIAEAGAGRVRITLDWGPQIEGRTPTAFAAGARVTVYARPEKMTLVAVEEDPAPTLNGVVRSRAFLGSRARYRVRLKGGPEVQVLAPAAGTARAWPPGAAVRVRLAADDLMVFPEAAA